MPVGETRSRPFLDMSHTILLLQSTNKLDSRTYSDYESVDECLDGMQNGNSLIFVSLFLLFIRRDL